MPIRPFLYAGTVTLVASSTGSIRFEVGSGEKGRFRRFQFKATAAFSIVGLRDSSGQAYSNASSSTPITSTILKTGVTDTEQVQFLSPPLELEGPLALIVDLLDTSGAGNTVRCVIEGEKET